MCRLLRRARTQLTGKTTLGSGIANLARVKEYAENSVTDLTRADGSEALIARRPYVYESRRQVSPGRSSSTLQKLSGYGDSRGLD